MNQTSLDWKTLDKIIDLFTQSGGKVLSPSIEPAIGSRRRDTMQLEILYGNPHWLYTPRGRYYIRRGSTCCNADQFFELLQKAFDVVMISDVSTGADRDSSEGYIVELHEKGSRLTSGRNTNVKP